MRQSFYHTIKRYHTLRTNRITALPIAIVMPHSSCNCRCRICDIWKGNRNLKQLTIDDIRPLLNSFRQLGTIQVVFSGGEALLHNGFFEFCTLLKKEKLNITLLSTGLLLKKHAEQLQELVDDIIVSLDGTEHIHDSIRNVPGAYNKLVEGVSFLKSINRSFRITARTVIHRLNYQSWPAIIRCAENMGLDQISFLPADLTSHAFNRDVLWSSERQSEIALTRDELPDLKLLIENLTTAFAKQFKNGFIAESPAKLMNIYKYYAAGYGLEEFPFKKCNAPWVSTVIEPDGSVKPCFFHPSIGNIRNNTLDEVLNGEMGMEFRKSLDMNTDPVCKRCVCSLNLDPGVNPIVSKFIV
ncbi:MAG: radical SAM protein [Chitinophagaceae bacterium]|nr:MAG: radical SAM protein [Chitinophagaceae bacterium]